MRAQTRHQENGTYLQFCDLLLERRHLHGEIRGRIITASAHHGADTCLDPTSACLLLVRVHHVCDLYGGEEGGLSMDGGVAFYPLTHFVQAEDWNFNVETRLKKLKFSSVCFFRLSRTTDTNPGHMIRSLRHPLARTMHTCLTDK